MINGAGNLCCRKLARFHASASLHRRSNPHAQFEIEVVRAHLEMVSENGADGLHVLRGEHRHQFADGGAEYLHHVTTCNGEMNDGGRLGLSLNDLRCLDHVVLLLSRSAPACSKPCRWGAALATTTIASALWFWRDAFLGHWPYATP